MADTGQDTADAEVAAPADAEVAAPAEAAGPLLRDPPPPPGYVDPLEQSELLDHLAGLGQEPLRGTGKAQVSRDTDGTDPV